jgi:hypothetical protein
MNPWHLIWIIPLSGGLGAFCMALIAVNKVAVLKKHGYTE